MEDNYSSKGYSLDLFSDDADSNHRRQVRRQPPRRPSKRSHRRRTKIRIFMVSAALFILFLFIMLIIGIVNLFTPRSTVIENLKTTEVTDKTVSLTWDKLDKAEGYNIYMMLTGGEGYYKATSVEGAETVTCTVKDLEQAKQYSFCVKAYYEDTESPLVKPLEGVYTLPEKPEITMAVMDSNGTLSLEWKKNDSADGYRIDFKKSDASEYNDSDTIIINSKEENKHEIPNLDASAKYEFKIASFIQGGEKEESKITGIYSDETEVDVSNPIRRNGGTVDPSKPMIALTFDDGPNDSTSGDRIVETLEKHGAKGTFFMVGNNAVKFPDKIKKRAEKGMELGNHTWDHTKYGENVSAEDIKKCTEEIDKMASPAKVTAFRSPGGVTTENILNECKNEGLPAYYWSIDTEDWQSRNADAVYNQVIGKVKDGDIVLMHEIYDSTADAVDRIVPKLIEEGYQLVTCSELVQAKSGNPPAPGTQYATATTTLN